ncbi:MAG: hypothetical protein NVSMB25_05360 [Thermoleophilaceae bacterium]
MSAPTIATLAMVVLGATLLSACESSQDQSKRLAKEGRKAFARKGLVVSQQNSSVKVLSSGVVTDHNGTAVVVALRNETATAMVGVPISIDVLAGPGTSVYRNDAPGLEPTLTQAQLLVPHKEFLWVNDQVTGNGARSVKPTVGRPARTLGGQLPKVDVSQPTLSTDPVSGVEAVGTATNRSKVEQLKLVVYCVALRGQKVVAAGRAQIARLKPGQKLPYHAFFIGDPHGAKVTVEAPPTVLG